MTSSLRGVARSADRPFLLRIFGLLVILVSFGATFVLAATEADPVTGVENWFKAAVEPRNVLVIAVAIYHLGAIRQQFSDLQGRLNGVEAWKAARDTTIRSEFVPRRECEISMEGYMREIGEVKAMLSDVLEVAREHHGRRS